VSVKDKRVKCKGKLKTTLQYEMARKTAHSFVATLAGMDEEVQVDSCRKMSREEVTVHVHIFCREEMSHIDRKVYDVATEIPKYYNVNTRQCQE
jgi:hypothetical protein